NAVGVDHENAPVGLEGPVDGAGVAPGDTVEHGGLAARLAKLGQLASLDGETFPVDDGAGAALTDLQVAPGAAAELHRAMDDLGSAGIGLQGGIPEQQAGSQHRQHAGLQTDRTSKCGRKAALADSERGHGKRLRGRGGGWPPPKRISSPGKRPRHYGKPLSLCLSLIWPRSRCRRGRWSGLEEAFPIRAIMIISL